MINAIILTSEFAGPVILIVLIGLAVVGWWHHRILMRHTPASASQAKNDRYIQNQLLLLILSTLLFLSVFLINFFTSLENSMIGIIFDYVILFVAYFLLWKLIKQFYDKLKYFYYTLGVFLICSLLLDMANLVFIYNYYNEYILAESLMKNAIIAALYILVLNCFIVTYNKQTLL